MNKYSTQNKNKQLMIDRHTNGYNIMPSSIKYFNNNKYNNIINKDIFKNYNDLYNNENEIKNIINNENNENITYKNNNENVVYKNNINNNNENISYKNNINTI